MNEGLFKEISYVWYGDDFKISVLKANIVFLFPSKT